MKKPSSSPEEFPTLTLLPSACVKDLSVDSYVKIHDHFAFVMKVTGKTRFLYPVTTSDHLIEYYKVARYSVLLKLHKALERELEAYLKAGGKNMPKFPCKCWLTNGRKLAEKRVVLLNHYFAQLFQEYSEILLYSNALIDFFEPQRIDLNILGVSTEESKEFTKTLATLVSSFEVLQSTAQGVARIGLKESRNDILRRAWESKDEKAWKKVIPFDYKYNRGIYRIDFQNLYPSNTSEGKREDLFNLYQTPHSGCIFAFHMDDRKSYQNTKELLGNIKLVKTDGRTELPPFIVVGLGLEQTKHEVKYDEVVNYLMDLFGDPCPYGYIEASYVTGQGIIEVLEAMIDTAIRLRGMEGYSS